MKCEENVVLKRINGTSLLLRDMVKKPNSAIVKEVAAVVHPIDGNCENPDVKVFGCEVYDSKSRAVSMEDLLKLYSGSTETKLHGIRHYCVEELGLIEKVDYSLIPCRPLARC